MQNDKLIEAIVLAKEIIDYCGGDSWERECTSQSRNKFYEIYSDIFPEQTPEKKLNKWEKWCDICNIVMPKGNYEAHINGKNHKKKIATQDI